MVYQAPCCRGHCGSGGETRPRLSNGRRGEEEGTADHACGTQPRDVGGGRQTSGVAPFLVLSTARLRYITREPERRSPRERACRRQSPYSAAWASFCSA